LEYKKVKKVQEIRHFVFKTSIFQEFKFETDKIYNDALASDVKLSKI
jgi:hypothetical protein